MTLSIYAQTADQSATASIVAELKAASAIKDPGKRLKAFDQIAEKYTKVVVATANLDVGKWTVSESNNPLDDSKKIIFGLTADSGVGDFQ